MAYEQIKRNRYFNPTTNYEYTSSERNYYEDFEEFHRPLARMQHANRHGGGIARGLEVSGTIGGTEIVIHSGVAIDENGQLISLSDAGYGDIGLDPPGDDHVEVPVPVHFPIDSHHASQTFYVTIRYAEILRSGEGAGGRWEQVPWIRLQPVSEVETEGEVEAEDNEGGKKQQGIVLAIVVIDADGKLTELKVRDSAQRYRRRLLGEKFEQLEIQCSKTVEDEDPTKAITANTAGIIMPGDGGGLRITVPNSSDKMTFVQEDGGHFANLKVCSDEATFDGKVGMETLEVTEQLQVAGNIRMTGQDFEVNNGQLRVTPDGHVGIETTNAKATLDVSGDGKFTGNLSIQGHVGIGIDEPQAKLEVNGTLQTTDLEIVNKDFAYLDIRSSENDAVIRLYDNDKFWSIHNDDSEANRFDIRYNKESKMRVTPDGSLSINGNIDLQEVDSYLNFGDKVRQMINLWKTSYGIGIQNWTQYHRSAGNFAWYIGGNHHNEELNAGGGKVALIIKRPNGNVGIGIDSPGYKLEVNGDISVGQSLPGRSAEAYGKKLHFNGAPNNSDPLWMARYNAGNDQTSLRINLGDNSRGDKLEVGFTTYNKETKEEKWHTVFSVDTDGAVNINGRAFLGYETTISDFGGVLKSGFYQNGGKEVTGDVPDKDHGWTHLITARHSNQNNNHQLQIASSYRNNDRLFFRKIQHGQAVSNNPSWHEIATRGPNEFSGDQQFNGSIRGNQSGALRINTGQGYVDIGPKNKDWAHFSTDRGKYYFNKEIQVDSGRIGSYNQNNLYLCTSGTPRITVKKKNGYVGIGTTEEPNYRLEVNGDISVGQYDGSGESTAAYGQKLYFNGAPRNTDPLWMARYNVKKDHTNLRINLGDNAGGDKLEVGYTYHEEWHPVFSVNTNGKVGIGIENPKKPLHVNANGTANPLIIENCGAPTQADNAPRLLRGLPNNSLIIGSPLLNHLYFYWRDNQGNCYSIKLKGKLIP